MTNKNNNVKKLKIFVLVLCIVLFAFAVYKSFPYFKLMTSDVGRDQLVQMIRGQGVWGVFIFILIQIFQVVIFIVPGEVVELAGGVLYGTFGGYLICTLGVILGTTMIYYLVRWLGYDFISKVVGEEEFKHFKFLNNATKLRATVFFLFLIPGTPKDGLTYFIPFTKMKLRDFLVLSSIARFPSIISSTYVGSNLQQGNYLVSIIAYAIVLVISVIGIWYNKKYMSEKEDNVKKDN
ncbi:MAG: VTT domain-containing protein [Erysipelotrichaceae bacterium]